MESISQRNEKDYDSPYFKGTFPLGISHVLMTKILLCKWEVMLVNRNLQTQSFFVVVELGFLQQWISCVASVECVDFFFIES